MARNKPIEMAKARRQFEEARKIIRRYDIQGEAARATFIALGTTWQMLTFAVAHAVRTGPGDRIQDADDVLLDARRAFQENHPDAPADLFERLEQALASAESLTAELSDGAQSILRQLGEDVSPVDRDLIQVALGKLHTIQPMMDRLL